MSYELGVMSYTRLVNQFIPAVGKVRFLTFAPRELAFTPLFVSN